MLRKEVIFASWTHPIARTEGFRQILLLVSLDDPLDLSDSFIGLRATTLLTVITESKLMDLTNGAPPVTAAQFVT